MFYKKLFYRSEKKLFKFHLSLSSIGRGIFIFMYLISLLGAMNFPVQAASTINFTGTELLGKPTDSSITIKIVSDSTIEYHYQYGTEAGNYSGQTSNFTATGGQPHEITISGLEANTRYYYRMRYHAPGDSQDDWVARTEYTFMTQRDSGSPFTFTITSDSHVNILLGNAATWTQTMENVDGDNSDFHIDLGDTFAMDNVTTVSGSEAAYRNQLEFFDIVSQSTPIYLAAGNHEQIEGWHLDDTGNIVTSKPVISINAMKKYFLNPVPDDFYSGNNDQFEYIEGDQKLGDYYAWEWGDALFVVLDPFWYTTTKPYSGNTGGGEDSDTGSNDRWDWTLGQDQFNWLKQTLEDSGSSYKFIFAHHMVGGSDDYVRGGAVPAHMFEWGGYNIDGTTWGFNTQRTGWGDEPVHQIMVNSGVSAFFHGHDHEYAYEIRDGIVYQSLPAASFTGSFGIYDESDQYTERVISGSGYLRVTVATTATTVEFVDSSVNKTVRHSYTMAPFEEPVCYALTLTSGVNGGDPTVSPTQSAGCGSGEYIAGQEITLTAHPNAGYQVANWNGTDDDTSKALTNVKTMPAEANAVHVNYEIKPVVGIVELDGAYSSGTGAANVSSVSFSHTTGTGDNRLMVVGASWNGGSTARTISSVKFAYDSTDLNFDLIRTEQAGTQFRYAAIYRSLIEPPPGTTGTVTVTFDGAVSNGIVAGAANFKGVDQTNPVTKSGGANGSSTAAGVTLTELNGNELIFDTIFQGASGVSQTLTTGAGQSSLWNEFVSNTRAAASTEQATAGSVTMSWTASSSSVWAIAAVAINPAPGELPTCYGLTLTSGANGGTPTASPTQSAGCGYGEYIAGQEITLTAHPDVGYQVASWEGTDDDTSKALTNSLTMPAEASAVHVEYEVKPPVGIVELDGAVSNGTGTEDVNSVSFSHTTGNGDNRFMLVGVSWNGGESGQSISTVKFDYDTEELDFQLVELEEVNVTGTVSGLRYAAIYRSVTEPPKETTGTLTITFNGAVSNGVVAGAVNFKGVDQTTPLGMSDGANGDNSSSPTITLAGLNGDELIFDTVFLGGADSSYTINPGSDQVGLWNDFSVNTRGAASTEQATGNSVTMSWTPTSINWWAIVAVPINPAPLGTNHPPTDIELSNNNVPENAASNTVVGNLSSIDPDAGDTFTYTLVSGEGSTDNASFNIAGNQLRTSTVFDYETKSNYSLRIQTKDQGELTFEKSFTITINDVNEAPVAVDDTFSTVKNTQLVLTAAQLTANDTDVDGDSLSVTGVSNPVNGNVNLESGTITFTPTTDFTGTSGFDYTVSDGDLTDTGHIMITVTDTSVLIHSIDLVAGWNLVSFNLHPIDTDIEEVLSSIEGKYSLVYAWNAGISSNNWLKYDPAQAFGNTLGALDETTGFWIRVLENTTLEVTGSYATTTTISLQIAAGGWNLVGYPSASNQALPAALQNPNGVESEDWMVYAYHANEPSDPWKLFDPSAGSWANDLTDLSPGWGYWIYVTEIAAWQVAY